MVAEERTRAEETLVETASRLGEERWADGEAVGGRTTSWTSLRTTTVGLDSWTAGTATSDSVGTSWPGLKEAGATGPAGRVEYRSASP